ncbi:hypothetical protein BD410DRAFT_426163 [Rickenella mellea]|uniref:TEA domain-containing protein n=1 Tax=Rickenella mellea TaxID=50990 RepID=A0A4Y7QJY1_9AGAM|nr:hypothetical protein BD410DRAFT_426163 [Rickenella mellea]
MSSDSPLTEYDRERESLPQRRHRKMLRDGSSEVWPQHAEDLFLKGLEDYWNSPWANFSRGRSRWRNQFLVDYLKRNGIERSKKQVASHIQVLRNMWKGHRQFSLVAGPEELDGVEVVSSTRSEPSKRRPSTSTSTSSRPSSTASSPPSTEAYESESASDNSPREASRRDTIRPGSLSLGSPLTLQIPPTDPTPHLKSEISPKLHHPFDNSPSLGAMNDMRLDPAHEFQLLNVTRVCGLGLWTDGMEPIYIDVDTLPSSVSTSFSPVPTSPGSSAPVIRSSLRLKLCMPASLGVENVNDAIRGFDGAVSFTTPVPSSAKCLTKVHVDGTCISRELAEFIPVAPPPSPEHADQGEQKFVALLPDSWLSRCRWLDTGSKKTLVTQQVIVDEDPLFVVIYDLHRVKHNVPTAELLVWHKHIDTGMISPSPTNTQFGHPQSLPHHSPHSHPSYDYSAASHSHQPHYSHTPPTQVHGFNDGSPPSPSSPNSNSRTCSAASQSMFGTTIDPWATSLLPLF